MQDDDITPQSEAHVHWGVVTIAGIAGVLLVVIGVVFWQLFVPQEQQGKAGTPQAKITQIKSASSRDSIDNGRNRGVLTKAEPGIGTRECAHASFDDIDVTEYADWEFYYNSDLGLALRYPSHLKPNVDEYSTKVTPIGPVHYTVGHSPLVDWDAGKPQYYSTDDSWGLNIYNAGEGPQHLDPCYESSKEYYNWCYSNKISIEGADEAWSASVQYNGLLFPVERRYAIKTNDGMFLEFEFWTSVNMDDYDSPCDFTDSIFVLDKVVHSLILDEEKLIDKFE